MRRIDSVEDEMRGVATYEFDDGSRVCLDARAVCEFGAATILRKAGFAHLLPTERLPVIQCGECIGTMAPDFDPSNIESKSFMYAPRPNDFRREGDAWVAAAMLGPGDLEAIPGFVWEPGR